MIPNIIHITGASGSGTSTLGRAIHKCYGHTHLDTDDFFWESTDPPFRVKRAIPERLAFMSKAMDQCHTCVLSGSTTDWGNSLIPRYDLVIYVSTPTPTRLVRLRKRELNMFRERILPGGDMYEEHQTFLDWAASYDTGGMEMRSALSHREWLKKLPCPVLEVDGTKSPEENLHLLDIQYNSE